MDDATGHDPAWIRVLEKYAALGALEEARQQCKDRGKEWCAQIRYELIEKAFAAHPERESARKRAVHDVAKACKVSQRTVETALAVTEKKRDVEDKHAAQVRLQRSA